MQHASIQKIAENHAIIPYEQIRCRHLLTNGRVCDKWIITVSDMVQVTKKDAWNTRVYCDRCKNYTYFKKK